MQFNWDWEYKNKNELNSIPLVKKLIYMESLYFHPEEPSPTPHLHETVKIEGSPAQFEQPPNVAKTPTAIRELMQTATHFRCTSPQKIINDTETDI